MAAAETKKGESNNDRDDENAMSEGKPFRVLIVLAALEFGKPGPDFITGLSSV